jgi:hypothetical protein
MHLGGHGSHGGHGGQQGSGHGLHDGTGPVAPAEGTAEGKANDGQQSRDHGH